MSVTAENSRWYKGKQRAVYEYRKSFDGIKSDVAAKDFLNIPGYFANIATDIEVATSMKLSDLNFEITKEAIDRELQNTEVEYDEAYKTALAEWEVEKQTLLSNMQRELNSAETIMKNNLEFAERLSIEIGRRREDIVNAQARLKEDVESANQDIIEARSSYLTQQNILMNAKRITSTKKAELITIVSEIIAAEEVIANKILDELIPAQEDVVTEHQGVIDKKGDLITAIGRVADVKQEYVNALNNSVDSLKNIKVVQSEKIGLRQNLLENDIGLLRAKIAVDDAQLEQINERSIYQQAKINSGVDTSAERIKSIADISNAKISNMEGIGNLDREEIDKRSGSRVEIAEANDNNSEQVVIADVDSEKNKIDIVSKYSRDATEEKAYITAAAEISSILKHLIS